MTDTIERKEMFHKYPSIENAGLEKFINKIKLHGFGNNEYCITEKIHGANTQICYNYKTNEFEYGKRTCQIASDEKCYNVQNEFEKIKEKVVFLANLIISKTQKDIETVIVYGEIFGGCYPHKEVSRDNKATKVQKGVYYSPHNEWRAFDVAYTVTGEDKFYFLCGHDFFDFCKEADIETVPLLTITTSLDEALKYPNDKPSIVYQQFNLPQLEDNIMEGVVIKPWDSDLWMGQSRVIIKNKNARFAEKSHEKKVNIQIDVPETVKKAMEEMSAFITEARVNNVISHLGEVSAKDVGKIIGLVSVDVLEDYKKEYNTLNTLEKTEEKMVTKDLQRRVSLVVRKVVLGID